MQGHPELYGSGHNVMLKPSVDVLTVKEDLDSAMEVFEELQAHVPFHFVRCGTSLCHASFGPQLTGLFTCSLRPRREGRLIRY
jgi:hypothetical protein